MPSIYDLKPRFQALLRPLVRFLMENGVIANHTALAAVLLSFPVGAIIALQAQAQWPLLLMPLALFLRMALNAAAFFCDVFVGESSPWIGDRR